MIRKGFLISLGLSLLLPMRLLATVCSCHEDIREMNMLAYNKTPVIFTGEVDKVDKCNGMQKVRFLSDQVFKGDVQNFTVYNQKCDSKCHLEFQQGNRYLIFAYYNNDSLVTKPCTRTRIMHDEKMLKKHLKSIPESDTASRNEFKREMEIWDHEMEFLRKVQDIKNGTPDLKYTNGQVTAKGEFKNGKPSGDWVYYYPDGKTKAKGKYDNDGNRKGVWEELESFNNYFEGYLAERKSTVRKFGTYKNGTKVGFWEIHNVDGTIYTLIYRNGKIVHEKKVKHTENIEHFTPNFITPNGNGITDKLKIRNLPDGCAITIFNKWGAEIYKKKDYKNNWKAKNTPQGIYYYKLTLPSNEILKGWIRVIRDF